MRAAGAVLMLGCLAAPVSVARADDCQSVADAYDRLSKAPAYRQMTSLNGKLLMESVIVGDDMYVKDGAKWNKLPLGPGGRVRMHQGLEIRTLDDYRRRYGQYKSDPSLQAAHARCQPRIARRSSPSSMPSGTRTAVAVGEATASLAAQRSSPIATMPARNARAVRP